jgi:hypothetical protein
VQQAVEQLTHYRRGFGAKVLLPSKEVLHEVLVGHAATVNLRAYHIGRHLMAVSVLHNFHAEDGSTSTACAVRSASFRGSNMLALQLLGVQADRRKAMRQCTT